MRDNEQRVRFLGFNTHVARTLIFAISCLFTGVAGALLAIANEAANYTIFSAQASANVVLQTLHRRRQVLSSGRRSARSIMTFFARVTSDLTRSWLLYQGLIFVLVMLFAPQGLGGLVALHARKVRADGWKHLVAPYLLCLVVGLLLIAGLRIRRREHPRRADGCLSRQAHGGEGRMGALRAVRPGVRAGLGAVHLGHSDRAARRSGRRSCRRHGA